MHSSVRQRNCLGKLRPIKSINIYGSPYTIYHILYHIQYTIYRIHIVYHDRLCDRPIERIEACVSVLTISEGLFERGGRSDSGTKLLQVKFKIINYIFELDRYTYSKQFI